jgi:hypothetical protein
MRASSVAANLNSTCESKMNRVVRKEGDEGGQRGEKAR